MLSVIDKKESVRTSLAALRHEAALTFGHLLKLIALFLGIPTIVFFLYVVPTNAAIVPLSQSTYSSVSTCSNGGGTGPANQSLNGVDASSTTVQGTVTGINIRFQACSDFVDQPVQVSFCGLTSGCPLSTYVNTVTASSGQIFELAFPQTYTISNYNQEFYININTSGGSADIRLLGSNTDTWPYGAAYTGFAPPLADAYFNVSGAMLYTGSSTPSTPTSTATGTVRIVKPENSTTTYEFDFFEVEYTAPASGQYTINVIAATSTDNLAFVSTNNQKDTTAVTGNQAASSTTYVYRGTLNPGGHVFCHTANECPTPTGTLWYAQAQIIGPDGSLNGYSEIVPFNVLFSYNNAKLPGEVPTETSSSLVLFELLDCPGGSIFSSSSLDIIKCSALNAVYTAANSLYGGVLRVADRIGQYATHIFPISLFIHLQNDISSARPTSTSTDSITVPIWGHEYTLASPNLIASGTEAIHFHSYRAFIDYLIWAVVGVVMILIGAKVMGAFANSDNA